jgi:hypothetical protein
MIFTLEKAPMEVGGLISVPPGHGKRRNVPKMGRFGPVAGRKDYDDFTEMNPV